MIEKNEGIIFRLMKKEDKLGFIKCFEESTNHPLACQKKIIKVNKISWLETSWTIASFVPSHYQ